MTDNAVTDDDRKAHEWADCHAGTNAAVVRAIRAHVPAPPATLADELRKWSDNYDHDSQSNRPWNDLDNLIDRVEAVEKENSDGLHERSILYDRWKFAEDERDEARAERDEFQNEMISSERKQAKLEAEVERLAGDREGQEEALTEHGRLLSDARAELTYWKEYALDRQREVERLTQERLDRNPQTKTRVDEALDNLDQAETVTINTDTGKPASNTVAEELLNPDSYDEDTDGPYVVFDQERMMRIVKRVEALEEMVK